MGGGRIVNITFHSASIINVIAAFIRLTIWISRRANRGWVIIIMTVITSSYNMRKAGMGVAIFIG